MWWIIWLVVTAVSLIVEFTTQEMVSIWFAVGGLICLILTGIIGDQLVWLQIVIFIVISIVLLLSLRKIALKYLLRNDNVKTNASSVIGNKLKLLSEIVDGNGGTIKVNDVVWTAKLENGNSAKKDELVEIVALQGNKYIVKPVNTNSEE